MNAMARGRRRHFAGCTCCGGKYDVLAYNFNGNIVRRQYHSHGGYNIEAGIKPGRKITIAADAGRVVCASDTNLSFMGTSQNGEATRLYEGVLSSQHLTTTDPLALAELAEGRMVRGNWRISKKSHSGDWWASCTSISSIPEIFGIYPQRLHRAWKLSSAGTLDGMPLNGGIDGDAESDYVGEEDYPEGSYFAVGAADNYAFSRFVDGTVPQSVIGGEQVYCAPVGFDTSTPYAGKFGFYGAITAIELRPPPANDSDTFNARRFFWGGAQFYHDGIDFAWCTRHQSIYDGPQNLTVSGESVTLALGVFAARLPVDFPASFDDAKAYYYDPIDEDFYAVDTPLAWVEDHTWHGIKHSYTESGVLKAKVGSTTYRELDFDALHELEGRDFPEEVRTVSNPFGSITAEGPGMSGQAIPKDVFVRNGFMYVLLPDEVDPRYWRRLVKYDLSDFSVVWTKTPPEDWQVFHSFNVDDDKIWVAVSASDGYVFEDPE